MTRSSMLLVAISFGFIAAGSRAENPPPKTSPAIAWVYREKIRMGWTPERWDQYQMMRDAGMNAVMPRLELDVPMDDRPHAFDQSLSDRDKQIMADLQKGSALAKELGLKYFHCLNFAAESQTYEGGFRGNSARYNDGNLPSPIDPVFWKRTIIDRVSRAMELLGDRDKYALDAVIIDPEMYALSGALPGDPDYGKFAFEMFCKETDRTAPASVNSVAARKSWLAEQKLDDQYTQWQFERIKSFGRELRDLVHRQRPGVILGYIIFEDRMWFKAMAAGLTSDEVPVFVGPESTYSGVMDQTMVDYLAQIRTSLAVPCLLTPGIDMGLVSGRVPSERLAILPGNIYQRCQHSAGYWVYAIYNFGATSQEQGAFFSALKIVDDALDEQAKTGQVVASLKAAPLPLLLPKGFHELLKSAEGFKPLPDGTARASFPYEPPMLRGSYVVLLWPDKGERQSITIRAIKLGNYLDVCNVQQFSTAGTLLQENPVPLNTSRVLWIPDAAGTPNANAITAGMNRWMIDSVTGKAMIFAEDMLAVNAADAPGGKFYFNVPRGCKEFGLSLLGEKGEWAAYSLFDPSGKMVGSWPKVTANTKETVAVTQPGVWCISVDHLVDDGGFALIGLPNLFALRAQDVMAGPGAGEESK